MNPEIEDPDEPRRRLAERIADAEQAYADLYDARRPITVTACYSGAKEYLRAAIALAGRLGLVDEQERLRARLAHIRAVFRSQFADFS
jgi:hypothetical protein